MTLPDSILGLAQAFVCCSSCPQVCLTVALLEHTVGANLISGVAAVVPVWLTPDFQLEEGTSAHAIRQV